MPILDLQKRLRELGRIRMGERGEKGQPKRLHTWRFTSPDKSLIEAASRAYGGEPGAWKPGPKEPQQWEVITEQTEIDIIIPPTSFLDQWYERWAQSGCERRCDGVTEVIQMRQCPCANDSERSCDRVTRLMVMLPALEGLGQWRLETRGFYASEELSGIAALLSHATSKGFNISATLGIEQRARKTKDHGTRRFTVPVINIRQQLAEFLALSGAGPALPEDGQRIEPPQPGRRATQRVPLAEGQAPKSPKPPAAKAAPELPRTQAPEPMPPERVEAELPVSEAPEEPSLSPERQAQLEAMGSLERLFGDLSESKRAWLEARFPETAALLAQKGAIALTVDNWNDIRVLAEEEFSDGENGDAGDLEDRSELQGPALESQAADDQAQGETGQADQGEDQEEVGEAQEEEKPDLDLTKPEKRRNARRSASGPDARAAVDALKAAGYEGSRTLNWFEVRGRQGENAVLHLIREGFSTRQIVAMVEHAASTTKEAAEEQAVLPW